MSKESENKTALLEVCKLTKIKSKKFNAHVAEIGTTARKSFKNVTPGTERFDENMFILGFVAGYLKAER